MKPKAMVAIGFVQDDFGKDINMNYSQILEQIIPIIDEVAAYQLEAKKNQGFGVETKGDNIDYVTDIDHKSEEMIVSGLLKLFPDHAILGEESGSCDKDSDWQWVIDPIDGTTNFVHSYPMHAISVGLKYKGERVLGLVEAPAMNMRFTAIKGQGAYLNGERISVSKTDSLLRSVIATGFPYSRKEANPNLPYFNKIVNEVSGIRRGGSAALDCCFAAAGMVDGYWEFRLNEWDVCAGILMVEEAGGKATWTMKDGDELIIVANETVHDLLADIVMK